MQVAHYLPVMGDAQPLIRVLLMNVQAQLNRNGYRQHTFHEAATDAYAATVTVKREGQVFSMTFKLHDGDEEGREPGFSVSLVWQGPDGQTLGRWCPYSGTAEEFTMDPDAVIERIKRFDVAQVAACVLADFELRRCAP